MLDGPHRRRSTPWSAETKLVFFLALVFAVTAWISVSTRIEHSKRSAPAVTDLGVTEKS